MTTSRPRNLGFATGAALALMSAQALAQPFNPNWVDTVRGAGQVNPVSGVPRNQEISGSDTLNLVMDNLLDAMGLSLSSNPGVRGYQGCGSSCGERVLTGSPVAGDSVTCTPNDPNGLPETNPGCQEIAPLSRALGSNVCDDDPDYDEGPPLTVSGVNTTAESLGFCADGLVIAVNNNSLGAFGEDAAACAAFHAQAQTPNDGNTFLNQRVGNLRFTGTLPSGAAISDWRTVIRLLYTGCVSGTCATSTAAERVARCSNPDRLALVQNWGLLFQGVACPQSAGCPQGLRHAYRRDDSSGTTNVFLELIGVAANPAVNLTSRQSLISGSITQTITPGVANQAFCDGGQVEGMLPTSLGPANSFFPSGEPLYDGGDPIRTPCAPEDDLCAADGRLGVVRAIRSTDTALDEPYPDHQCQRRFAYVQYINSSLPVCPDRTKPSAGRCRFPIFESGTFRTFNCLASRNQVDGKAAAGTDGRAYNFVAHAEDGAGTVYFQDGATRRMPVTAMWRQNMAQLNTGALFNGKQFVASDYVCTESDATRNIGCLVANSRCTIGYAGREATFNTSQPTVHLANEPAKLNGFEPSNANIGAGAYPFSRLLYLVANRGFENIMLDCVDRGGSQKYCEDQVAIANAIYNTSDAPGNLVGPICNNAGYIALSQPVCVGGQATTATPTTPACGAPAVQPLEACRPDTRSFASLTNRDN